MKKTKVLLDAWASENVTGGPSESYECPANGEVHPHPGVPVAALLLEIAKLRVHVSWLQDIVGDEIDPTTDYCWLKAEELRTAREAAQKPQLKEGQEVWVRARYGGERYGRVDHSHRVDHPHGADISSTVEPCEWFVTADDIKVDDE